MSNAITTFPPRYYRFELPCNLRDPQVMDKVVVSFCGDLSEQETRLNQLEAALATYTAQPSAGATVPDPYDLLGAHISLLPEKDEAYAQVVQFLSRTSCHGYTVRVRDIFAIEIPSERAAFTANTFGSHLILRLTHGTNNANVRHILHEHGAGSGLRLPHTYTHGWMFGPGIYFANVASKSAQYCRGRSGYPRMMFLADVAGRHHVHGPRGREHHPRRPKGRPLGVGQGPSHQELARHAGLRRIHRVPPGAADPALSGHLGPALKRGVRLSNPPWRPNVAGQDASSGLSMDDISQETTAVREEKVDMCQGSGSIMPRHAGDSYARWLGPAGPRIAALYARMPLPLLVEAVLAELTSAGKSFTAYNVTLALRALFLQRELPHYDRHGARR